MQCNYFEHLIPCNNHFVLPSGFRTTAEMCISRVPVRVFHNKTQAMTQSSPVQLHSCCLPCWLHSSWIRLLVIVSVCFLWLVVLLPLAVAQLFHGAE